MNNNSYLIAFILSLALVIAAIGCSGSKETTDERRYFWPEPPDPPRVEYVRTLHGESDFAGGLSGLLRSITGGSGGAGFARPFDICIAGDGKYYITDAVAGVIFYDSKNKKVEQVGDESVIELKDPRGIAYAHGKLFIGLAGSGKVAVLDDQGKVIRAIGHDGRFQNPVDIVCDTTRRRVYVFDIKQDQITAFTEEGDSLFTVGTPGEGDGQLHYPISGAVDSAGNLYVVDSFNFRVVVFDSTGKYLRKFGRQGDYFGDFARPKGIALDSYGNIYVVDGVHQHFQIFNNAGELLMFVGKYSFGNDGFQNPVSIAIDGHNTIYVTDHMNARVQVFQLLEGN